MIESIQGTAVMGSNNPVNVTAGNAPGKKTTQAETADYKVSLNKEVISTITYERTGSIGAMDKSEAVSVEALLSRLFERQGMTYEEAMSGETVEIDPQTRSEAQALISEDGYWGVDKTSERIVEFAIAGAGGDEAKLAEIKAAIDKGFGMARKSFGGSLPDISSKTYDAVMKKLDAWADQEV
ncbi:MAG: hypothetical protein V2B19_29535 [Pseudomonadota bacterium]